MAERATQTEGRLHPDHRLRAGRAGRGARRVRAAGPRGRDPPRGLVGQRARQAGARPARRLAHPGAAAAGADARHRQRERAAGQCHDAAGERQRAHALARAVAGDRGGGARARRQRSAARSPRAIAAVVASAPPRAGRSSCSPRCSPTRCSTTWCGCGCRRAASIPTATCGSPSCRRRTPWRICRAA